MKTIAISKKQSALINEKIKANELMLIGISGEKLGIVSLDQALKSAKDSSLDLVQVSPPNADPVVCKLLDYGKHLFDKRKAVLHQK